MQVSKFSQPVKPFEYQPTVPMRLMMSVMDNKSRTMTDNLMQTTDDVPQERKTLNAIEGELLKYISS